MTLSGIVTLVFGFGYLLQYSFSEYLGPAGKVFIGFVLAISATVGGVRFTQKRADMADYGSSLIALGIILNYLCAYFAGPYFGLLSDISGFLLLAAVTAVAYLLALVFETRVVALVTLIGGATMPLVMNHSDGTPLLYLSYLLVLVCAMLSLSYRIRWPQLAYASMALSAGMIEFSIANRVSIQSSLGLIAVVHGFFYAFGYYALRGLGASTTVSRATLIIVSANIITYLLFTQQLSSHSQLLGGIYLLNVLPWIVLFLVPGKLLNSVKSEAELRTVQAMALLHAGLLVGVGVLVLSSPEMMGIIWSIEGALLVYLGTRFSFTSVRVEGYVTLFISLLSMAYQVIVWVADGVITAPELLSLSIGIGWGNLITITGLIYVVVGFLKDHLDSITEKEQRLYTILSNLLAVFISVSFLLSVSIYWAQGMWLLSIVPMFYLIWAAQKEQSTFTEFFGLAHYLLLAIPLAVSAGVAGNFHFSEQSIYGQVARIEAFLCLWLLAEFYKRYCVKDSGLGFAENFRKLFYCLIPLFFLPSVFRKYGEYFPIALWLSSSIALLLFYRLQYSILKLELRLLVIVASIAAVYSCWLIEFTDWQGNAIGALAAGLVFYLFIGWIWQGLNREVAGSSIFIECHHALKPLFTASIYYTGVSAAIILYGVTGVESLAMFVALLFFSSLFFVRTLLVPVRHNLKSVYVCVFLLFIALTVNQLLVVIPHRWESMPDLMAGLFNLLALVCMAMILVLPTAQTRAIWRSVGHNLLNLWIFNLVCIAAYVTFLAQIFSELLGPLVSLSLVLHATVVLFQTINPRMKKLIGLSILLYAVAALKILLWDMQGFSLVQKIIVFMLIGLCMLGAAFKFQKIMTRNLVEKKSGDWANEP